MLSLKEESRRNQIDGFYVKLEVQDTTQNFLIDTGASITVIRREIFQGIAEGNRPCLERTNESLCMADESRIPVVGWAMFSLKIGDFATKHKVWVADIQADGILGCDFLTRYECQLDLGRGELRIANELIRCLAEHPAENSCQTLNRITVCETFSINPGQEVIVQGKLKNPLKEGEVIVEPYEKFTKKYSVMVAKVVASPQSQTVPVRMINLDSVPVTVYKGSTAATCEPVEEVTAVELDGADLEVAPGHQIELSSHVLPLYQSTKESLDENQKTLVLSLLKKHEGVFARNKEDLGRTNIVKHKIPTKDVPPIKQQARRLPLNKREEAAAEVSSMLKRGVIEPSQGPWASPVVLVRKKDGSTRFCVDYRRLNDVTIKDSYPIPRIDDSLDTLCGSSWFSTLDLASGYWQVEMDEPDKEKTAFVTQSGLYQFCVLPFGLSSAPATFERLMEKVLSGLQWQTCLVYLDDVIIFAKTFEEHVARFDQVLTRLKSSGLKLSPKKCHLFRQKVAFLGHVVSKDGVSTDPTKVAAVENWPRTNCVRDARRFLGLCSYYRKFVKNFTHIARPLHRLTEKGKQFLWTEECEKAFNELKHVLTSAPILAFPTPTDKYILDTDASSDSLGGVLSQVQGGEEKVIAYFSKSFSKPERRYCVTRKELYAIVASVKHFHHYLYGAKFLVRTDHSALRWLLTFKNPEGQVAHWLEVLALIIMK
ncbi:hypothetical protein HOLleu_24223 [Holothuria leucospilota]|uniref:Reverse transcriptase domain-containing protein n=1 Tax=Holothuria leucospilota TaxID=206669 RepID=A0A9Q1H653_HOLLE|nr:hypothetical protein HOLleu_24223 [Holothuria leucospilota]